MDMPLRIREALEPLAFMFGLSICYEDLNTSNALTSGHDVNVLLSFSQGLRGNLVIGLSLKAALLLSSAMMGSETKELDLISRSALTEFGNMLMGSVLTTLPLPAPAIISPPTLVAGENVFIVISRVRSYTLRFSLGNEPMSVAFCLE